MSELALKIVFCTGCTFHGEIYYSGVHVFAKIYGNDKTNVCTVVPIKTVTYSTLADS